ncbi:glycosyltransferase family 4 protein [Mucilaginibacter robiniae]|uniref:Glycosyltransferase family 4 protein n=1 Tax=Mucilaginibacter robiniae TaxID=2728022 RepID=A0A7L5E1A4_9SPHI|nr:glycosyltransferase family 1 protein [Mucilaginibacter robiniae]QJD95324.1 glycosyltransferase family 4 protein [Mucilaginibacter robiniae]
MKILFDHQVFSLQRYGGISRYFANLNQVINTIPDNSSRIAALYSKNEYLKKYQFPLSNAVGKSLLGSKQKRNYAWNRRYSRWNVRLADYDVFHPTYYDPYFIKYKKKPCVVTVHDMVHELYPEYFADATEMINRKRKVIQQADALIAISEHTRQDIIKVYPELASKITVVYHGYIFNESQPAYLELPEQYILFVGERWHYKNFPLFIQGMAPILKGNQYLNLICAGGGAFNGHEIQLLQSYGIGAQCLQMNVTDSILKQLYAQAQLFVFPSLLEGFGLPLLEAFASGCPVACSDTTAFPEVGGDAAIYFDPQNIEAIKSAVNQILSSIPLQQELKRKGLQQLQRFAFDDCVQNTLKVYQSLL